MQSVLTNNATIPLPNGGTKQFDSRYDYTVTELEQGPLDPTLFEIPPGFRHVDKIERNPVIADSPGQLDFWQRLKAELISMFSR